MTGISHVCDGCCLQALGIACAERLPADVINEVQDAFEQRLAATTEKAQDNATDPQLDEVTTRLEVR